MKHGATGAAYSGAQAVSSGFTLIEILLAMAIAVLISGVIFSVYHTVTTTTQALHVAKKGSSAAVSVMEGVDRDLACCVHIALAGETPFVVDSGLFEEEEFSSLAFYTAAFPDKEDDPREFVIHRVSYRVCAVQDRSTGSRVLMREIRTLEDDGALSDPLEEELAECVEKFQVAVFDGSEWHSKWPVEGGSSPLPSAARIVFSRKDGRVTRTLESEVLIRTGMSFERGSRSSEPVNQSPSDTVQGRRGVMTDDR